MREIVNEVLALLDSGEDFALVKLAGDRGSTPRAAGAEMLVRRDGSIAGTIGGGLLELTMMREAASVLETRAPRLVDLRLAGEDLASDEEMVCGGSAEVLITYVPAGDAALREVASALKEARATRRRAWLFTLLPPDLGDGVEYCLLGEDGDVTAARPCEPQALRAAVGKVAVHGTASLPDGRRLLVEPVEAPPTAVVCGGGHVGRAVAPAALAAGFAVTVLDDREEFADPRRFPGARTVLGPFHGALERLGVDQDSYIVIVTRGHTHDRDVLEQALRTPARYVGLMASRSKHARMVAALREAGLGDDDISRVHSPIGLDIGAETPGELAVSIVAEMIGAHRQDGLTMPAPMAVVLAAGASSRMQALKPLLDLEGRSMLARAVGAFAGAGVQDVVVVTGHRGDEVGAAAAALGARPVANSHFENGMYSSVQAGAAAVPVGRRFFLLPVDCPLVRPETVGRLARTAEARGAPVAVPVYDGRPGHPPLLGPELRSELLAARPAGGLRELLAARPERVVNLEVDDPGVLHDADTPGELEALRRAALREELPSRERCFDLLAAQGASPALVAHATAVAAVATALAAALNERRQYLCRSLVEAAGLLHDVARAGPRHAHAGADLLAGLGYFRLAPLVRTHMVLGEGADGLLDEAQVVYLADKLVLGKRVVNLEERFATRLAQVGDDPAARETVLARRDEARRVLERVEAVLEVPAAVIAAGAVGPQPADAGGAASAAGRPAVQDTARGEHTGR